MNEPFFSICIPNYNYGGFVGETIQSALDQTFKDLEIIVVDNASTDNSWEVIQQYAARDSRIKTFRNQCNVGFAPNLQKATEKASGKFIILLSSDDLIYPTALEEYHRIIGQEGEHVVLHSGFDYVGPEGNLYQSGLRFIKNDKDYYTTNIHPDQVKPEWDSGSTVGVDGLHALRHSILNGKSPAAFCSTCYPRVLWQKLEGYDLKYISGPDTVFLYKLLAFNPRLIYVKKRLFGYRVHNFNQTSQAMASGALKQQVDKYVYSFSIENETLKALSLDRKDVAKAFVKLYCFSDSIANLSGGKWERALKLYFMAWATYPGIAVKSGLGYINLLLLLSGPVGIFLLKLRKRV